MEYKIVEDWQNIKRFTFEAETKNGRKCIIDFSSVNKFEKIWIFQEIKVDLRKNSAVMQTLNSGKLIKIFLNVKNAQKFRLNKRR